MEYSDIWVNSISLVVLALYLVWQFMRHRHAFWFLLPFNVSHVWIILSNAYIEHGAYIREQFLYGELAFTTALFTAYSVAFGIVFTLAAWLLNVQWGVGSRIQVKAIGRILMALAVAYFGLSLFAIYKGTPVLTGQSRFAFLEEVGFVAKKMFLFHYCAGFFIGLGLRHQDLRRLSLYAMLATFLGCILMGDKFSALFWTMLAICGGYFSFGASDARALFRMITTGMGNGRWTQRGVAVFGLFAVGIVPIWGYTKYHNIEAADMAREIGARIFADQGAMWHGTCRLVMQRGPSFDLQTILGQDTLEAPSGVNALMYEVTDPSFARLSREAGISFAMGYVAVMVYNFGIVIGILLALLAAGIVAVVAKVMQLHILHGDYILLVIATNIYYICQDIFLMGRTWKMVGWQFLPLVLLVGIALFKHRFTGRERRSSDRLAAGKDLGAGRNALRQT